MRVRELRRDLDLAQEARCADGLGVPASECLVIEDGELGIEAARRAGMPWVRVEAYAMPASLGAV